MQNLWNESDKRKQFQYIGKTTTRPLTIIDFINLNSNRHITIPENAILKDGFFYLLTAADGLVQIVVDKQYYQKVKTWNLFQEFPNIDLSKLEVGKKYQLVLDCGQVWKFKFKKHQILANGEYNLQDSNWGYLPNGTIKNPPSPTFLRIKQIFVYD